MRRTLPLLIATLIFLISAPALALDGYKDRRGSYFGLGLGGGAGSVFVEDEALSTGLDDGSDLGLHLHAAVGGGVTQNLLFGAELNTWIRTTDVYGQSLNHQHWSLNAVSTLFLVSGLFAEAGVGLAYGISDAARPDGFERRYQEMGLALKGGVGFEYFINGTIAPGFRLGYTRHFYSTSDFETLTGGISIRWY
ncbi:hypothetical protein DL240_16625 [Lujinxingia litoralis]|uniref:Outer membrane protein beta-barrel domain-containing protein n=1 Tax=Lujinxingia litoralis TaxID=2211119 RepID=A0A328C2C5_9DELT|nr:outer membrane beta-barrel protein [Lujinxingia litoralis]RAL20429.1 hypothetical protein DL240_16625 [Lujinxingia litoralis]